MRAALLLLAAAAPAAAQDAPAGTPARAFQPPPGCTATLTVQEASCTVAHHMTCAADPPGATRRVAMDEGGVSMVSVTDAEFQWLETDQFLAGTRETLAAAPDPASLSGLLATGVDSYDFTTDSAQVGPTRYVGEDRLTGESATIDGEPLERTTFSYRALDGEGREVFSVTGSQFVDRARRTFFGGPATITSADGVEAIDDSPVEFIGPGEPGFLSASPKHGCGLMMSKARTP